MNRTCNTSVKLSMSNPYIRLPQNIQGMGGGGGGGGGGHKTYNKGPGHKIFKGVYGEHENIQGGTKYPRGAFAPFHPRPN